MLVLTRHSGQRVYVGDSVVVTVVKIRGQKVRLAFEAPPAVRIDREEVRACRRQWQAALGTVDVVLAPNASAVSGSDEVPRAESTEPPAALLIDGAT